MPKEVSRQDKSMMLFDAAHYCKMQYQKEREEYQRCLKLIADTPTGGIVVNPDQLSFIETYQRRQVKEAFNAYRHLYKLYQASL